MLIFCDFGSVLGLGSMPYAVIIVLLSIAFFVTGPVEIAPWYKTSESFFWSSQLLYAITRT
jgi:hypothetical protein